MHWLKGKWFQFDFALNKECWFKEGEEGLRENKKVFTKLFKVLILQLVQSKTYSSLLKNILVKKVYKNLSFVVHWHWPTIRPSASCLIKITGLDPRAKIRTWNPYIGVYDNSGRKYSIWSSAMTKLELGDGKHWSTLLLSPWYLAHKISRKKQ